MYFFIILIILNHVFSSIVFLFIHLKQFFNIYFPKQHIPLWVCILYILLHIKKCSAWPGFTHGTSGWKIEMLPFWNWVAILQWSQIVFIWCNFYCTILTFILLLITFLPVQNRCFTIFYLIRWMYFLAPICKAFFVLDCIFWPYNTLYHWVLLVICF